MGTHVYQKWGPDCTFNGNRVLNVGCGFGKYAAKNVVNLDAYASCSPDVVWDLSKTPLPFEDGSFDMIIANHIMEHVPNWWDAFNDFARILRDGGEVIVYVPGNGSDSILGYRDHINTINHCSFAGTHGTYRNGSNAWAEENRKGHAGRLKLVHHSTTIRPELWWVWYAPSFFKKWACTHLRNVSLEDGYLFRKVSQKEHEEEQSYADIRAAGHGGSLIQVPSV